LVQEFILESMGIKIDRRTPGQEEYLAGWSEGTGSRRQAAGVRLQGAAQAAPILLPDTAPWNPTS